jgi:hypothetical protein
MPSKAQTLAITFAYEKGFAAGLSGKNTENVFAETGGQTTAFDIGVEAGQKAKIQRRWIDPNDKTLRVFIPEVGQPVLFRYGNETYFGKRIDEAFQTGYGKHTRYFKVWACKWLPLDTALMNTQEEK